MSAIKVIAECEGNHREMEYKAYIYELGLYLSITYKKHNYANAVRACSDVFNEDAIWKSYKDNEQLREAIIEAIGAYLKRDVTIIRKEAMNICNALEVYVDLLEKLPADKTEFVNELQRLMNILNKG